MKTTKKVKIGVIGCGQFGQKRIQSIRNITKQAELAGVIDIDVKKTADISKKINVPFSKTIKELVKLTKIDAVIIATPNSTHEHLTEEALMLGLHVLCEKPLTSTLDQANRIVTYSKKYRQFVKTGSNHRYFPAVKKALELFQMGKIGKILSLRGSIGNDGSLTAHSWFRQRQKSGGGTFLDNGCHLLDLARLFMGNFVSCVGHTASVYWKNTAVEDIGVGIFVTSDDRPAVIYSSWTKWYGYLSLELWGDKGFIIIDNENQNTLTIGDRNTGRREIYDFSSLPKQSYEEELIYFISCIREGIPPAPGAADGREVVAMVQGIYTSVRKRKWVAL